jgi:hypothetical protein
MVCLYGHGNVVTAKKHFQFALRVDYADHTVGVDIVVKLRASESQGETTSITCIAKIWDPSNDQHKNGVCRATLFLFFSDDQNLDVFRLVRPAAGMTSGRLVNILLQIRILVFIAANTTCINLQKEVSINSANRYDILFKSGQQGQRLRQIKFTK